MTLIVGGGNAEYVVLASDTRLSWNGKLVDDRSPKIGNYRFYDGRLISAYTGLAKWNGFETREWLLSALAEMAQPWVETTEVMSLLVRKITTEFKGNADLAKLSADQRRLTIVLCGFVNNQSSLFLLSNFEDHKELFPSVLDEFILTKIVGKDSSFSWTGCYGARSGVGAREMPELNELIDSQKDAIATKGKCHAIVVRAAANPKSGDTIGPNILTATLPRDGEASSWYSPENTGDQIITFDNFHSYAGRGYAMAIRDLRILAPGIASGRPKRRGRGGKHEP